MLSLLFACTTEETNQQEKKSDAKEIVDTAKQKPQPYDPSEDEQTCRN